MDVDARRLDPQQIVERQRVAPLLQRQHDLAGVQREQMIGQACDVVAVDRRLRPPTAPSFMPTKPTTAKPAPRDAASASIRAARGPGAEHQHAPLQPLAAERVLERRCAATTRAIEPSHIA